MVVVAPSGAHMYTVILAHGFSSTGVELHAKVHEFFPTWFARQARFVYLTAPLRRITCYGERWYRAWHDYLTHHGDDGEAVEESIAFDDLLETREALHAAIRREWSVARPLVLFGESQGGCCAIDAALTSTLPVHAIATYAMRYSSTPERAVRAGPHAHVFHSRTDAVIPYALARASLAHTDVRWWVADNLTHATVNGSFKTFLHQALERITTSQNKKKMYDGHA